MPQVARYVDRVLGLGSAVTIVASTLVILTSSPASASVSTVLSAVNSARVAHGLHSLSLSSSLSSIASNWSAYMAAGRCSGGASICHNPSLGSQVSGWQKLGENVGAGPDISSVDDALWASPPHRANILDPDYTLIGIGVVTGKDGRVYITQDFERPFGSTSSSSSGSTSHKSTSSSSHTSTSSGSTSHHSSSSAPRSRSSASSSSSTPSAPRAKAPALRPAVNPLVAAVKSLTARALRASDPVDQALTFHENMHMLAR